VNGKSVLRIRRDFTNLSGASISVSETGILARYKFWTYDLPAEVRKDHDFLIIRDVVSPAVEVPDGYNLRVTYALEFYV